MKSRGIFVVHFEGHTVAEVDKFSNSVYTVDGKDLFQPDQSVDRNSSVRGHVLLTQFRECAEFTLTIPSGQLAGRICRVWKDEGQVIGLSQPRPFTHIEVDGVWKGAEGGLFHGQSVAAWFRPLSYDAALPWMWEAWKKEEATLSNPAEPVTANG